MASGDDFAYHEWARKGASRVGSQSQGNGFACICIKMLFF